MQTRRAAEMTCVCVCVCGLCHPAMSQLFLGLQVSAMTVRQFLITYSLSFIHAEDQKALVHFILLHFQALGETFEPCSRRLVCVSCFLLYHSKARKHLNSSFDSSESLRLLVLSLIYFHELNFSQQLTWSQRSGFRLTRPGFKDYFLTFLALWFSGSSSGSG